MIRRFKRFFEQQRDWERADSTNKEFVSSNKELLKNLELGATFSPEHVEYLNKRTEVRGKGEVSLDCLKVVVEEFNIKDIRLGIRWNSVDRDGRVDLSYYRPFLQYCFDKEVKVTLNVGPIKTFRWPEQFVPDRILNSIPLPKKGSYLTKRSDLVSHAVVYLETLYKQLQKEFSEKDLKNICTIQLENEPFHPFGQYQWRMAEDYMEHLINLTLSYFPHVSFLINSSETRNLKKIARFYQRVIDTKPMLRERLIVGYNFFYKVPKARTVPGIGTFDSITINNINFKKLWKKNIEWSRQIGYKIEVTEGQTEPWLPITSPGNSALEFRFLTLRVIKYLLNQKEKSVLRIWGIEHLALARLDDRLSRDQIEIIEIIQSVNGS